MSFDNFNAVISLCAETGPICEACSLGKRVVALICVSGRSSDGDSFVLAPCGVCQERLALWGPDAEVGVGDGGSTVG